MVDLHIHTKFSSDGMYSPAEIIEMAVKIGIKTVSFTDHNEILANYDGVELASKYAIKYITGVEFNSFWQGKDVHVLGYFIDFKSKKLHRFIEEIKDKKLKQTRERVKKLQELGFSISLEDVLAEAKSRPATGVTFLKSMLKRPENLKDERLFPYLSGEKSRSPFMNFYNDYLIPGKPAFVELKDTPTEEVIKLIKECRGVPVVAHPKDLDEEQIKLLKGYGAAGIEAYSSYHSEERKCFYVNLAEKLNMVVTAGSDFHGEEIKKDVKLGSVGEITIDVVTNLEKVHGEMYG